MRFAQRLAGAVGLSAATMAAAALVTAAPAVAAESGAPCGPAARACVDLSQGRAWLMERGRVTFGPVGISAGSPGYRTPTGRFTVTWKDRDHRSREYDGAPMPYAVFFTRGGVAFHQGDRSSNSHGCVRLSRDAAATFYRALQPGDVVQVRR